MTNPTLEEEVLERLDNDYGAAHTITPDIARDSGRAVTEDEVRKALIKLAHQGLVQAYLYNATAQRYQSIRPGDAEAEKEPWFRTIARGS
jgi:hypothetical protein